MGYRNWKRHLLALTMASSMILSTGSIGAEEPLIEDIGVEISQNMEEEQSVDIMGYHRRYLGNIGGLGKYFNGGRRCIKYRD